jgi:hypothetical protein
VGVGLTHTTLGATQAGEVVIESADGRILQQLPIQRVVKWAPSSSRAHNPGPPTCVDLHLSFPEGTRELRLRCNAEKTVADISAALRVRRGAERNSLSGRRGVGRVRPRSSGSQLTLRAHGEDGAAPVCRSNTRGQCNRREATPTPPPTVSWVTPPLPRASSRVVRLPRSLLASVGVDGAVGGRLRRRRSLGLTTSCLRWGEDGWRTEHEGGELDACLARAAAAEDQVRRLIVRFASPTPLTLALTRTRPLIGAGEDTGADVHGRARACGRPAGAARAQPLPRQHTGGAVQHPGGAALHTGGAVLRVASATPSPASAARTENEFVLALGERERLVGRND